MPFVMRITPILPKGDFPLGQFMKFEKLTTNYLRGELRRTLIGDFGKTIQNWAGKPGFTGKTTTGITLSLHVYPTGPHAVKWARLDAGVPGRLIVSKGKPLTIQSYTPHTRPKGKWGGPGKRFGAITYAKQAQWPGIRSREFSKIIAKRREAKIVSDVHRLVRKAFEL